MKWCADNFLEADQRGAPDFRAETGGGEPRQFNSPASLGKLAVYRPLSSKLETLHRAYTCASCRIFARASVSSSNENRLYYENECASDVVRRERKTRETTMEAVTAFLVKTSGIPEKCGNVWCNGKY